jgi:hypothetical protein
LISSGSCALRGDRLGGDAAPGDGAAYADADAVLELMERPARARRRAARKQAECFPWPAAVDGFLSAHDAASEYVSSVLGNRPA